MLTQDQLKEVLHYCPETGVFTWLVSMSPRARKGAEAGSTQIDNRKHGKAYRRLRLFGHRYSAHRLAFLYMTGEFPEHEVDHKDGNGCNNVWTNLRAVTRAENVKNARKSSANTSGTTGVTWVKSRSRWYACIGVKTLNKNLGYFHNKEDAIAARKAAEVLYGFHENHGTERPL